MLELPHTLFGALIGIKIQNPFISLPLAFASHFALDLIPHWNPSLYSEYEQFGHPKKSSTLIIIFDTVISLISGILIATTVLPDIKRFIVVLLACFLAVLPDVIEGPFFFFSLKWPILIKIIDFQRGHQGKAKLPWGMVTQLVAIIIIFIVFQL